MSEIRPWMDVDDDHDDNEDQVQGNDLQSLLASLQNQQAQTLAGRSPLSPSEIADADDDEFISTHTPVRRGDRLQNLSGQAKGAGEQISIALAAFAKHWQTFLTLIITESALPHYMNTAQGEVVISSIKRLGLVPIPVIAYLLYKARKSDLPDGVDISNELSKAVKIGKYKIFAVDILANTLILSSLLTSADKGGNFDLLSKDPHLSSQYIVDLVYMTAQFWQTSPFVAGAGLLGLAGINAGSLYYKIRKSASSRQR